MSSQPSQMDVAKEQVSNTAETVINKVAPPQDGKPPKPELTKDANGQTIKKDSFKDQLNAASRRPAAAKEETTFVEKVCSYIPGLQSKTPQEPEKEKLKDDGTPPTRPDNDVQVEEFLRSQYKSTGEKAIREGKN